MKFSRIQEIIELKKQKQVLHLLKMEILALGDGQLPTDEETKAWLPGRSTDSLVQTTQSRLSKNVSKVSV